MTGEGQQLALRISFEHACLEVVDGGEEELGGGDRCMRTVTSLQEALHVLRGQTGILFQTPASSPTKAVAASFLHFQAGALSVFARLPRTRPISQRQHPRLQHFSPTTLSHMVSLPRCCSHPLSPLSGRHQGWRRCAMQYPWCRPAAPRSLGREQPCCRQQQCSPASLLLA